MVNLEASVQNRTQNLNVELESLTQDIEVGMSCNIVYAFSPTVNITQLQNGNYLITITDKYGTTTAEVTNVTSETIQNILDEYFETHDVISTYIRQHDTDPQSHQDIRDWIQEVAQQATAVTASEINGNIVVDGHEIGVYTLPNKVLSSDDILILDCGHANTEYIL